jgi:hypothetical protein
LLTVDALAGDDPLFVLPVVVGDFVLPIPARAWKSLSVAPAAARSTSSGSGPAHGELGDGLPQGFDGVVVGQVGVHRVGVDAQAAQFVGDPRRCAGYGWPVSATATQIGSGAEW